ncbi:helix-turn-helix transcriptional regulator [Streptomyces sp. SP17BM10]|uniref:helix-turn-helix domain-containing protein n=1 Tax=Streptomyces sp. SP17BM10 TaxID=3002530 RepID=UPI002E75BE1F|nr:helix-turn-helix transcriptional regulator [Streptomyces sp. SP17BM10]MEE1787668.1 helix-turn-helix transcriptional regulator [Streptomyces sp. SP17BM10]
MSEPRRPIEDFPAHPGGDPAADLAHAVRERRTALGLSVEELAQRTRLTEGRIRAIEAGRAAPTLPLLTVLAGALRTAFTA